MAPTSTRVSRPNLRTEAIAGVTTFFTMAYIVVVNPSILSLSGSPSGQNLGIPFSGALTATVALCVTMTLLMGLYAKLPFAVAPGMGINAFFAYHLVEGRHIPWPTALGMVFWAGVLFLVLSLTPVRERVAKAIPSNLRRATAVGIGIFLTFIGLKNTGLIVADPVTLVKLGALTPENLLSVAGVVPIVLLMRRRNPLAFLVGILSVTLLLGALGKLRLPTQVLSWPDFGSVLFKLDLWGALQWSFVPAIISIFFTDLFDSLSTFVGVAHATGLVEKNGQPKNLRQGLIVDAWATLGAGLLGTSSGTAFVESSAGIEAGGRTGWTSVFTALCFVPCFFLAPLAGAVPALATAPVLLVVGALLFRTVGELDLQVIEDVIPAFLTIVLIPLTFSITQGILWGFLAHVVLYALAGRRRQIEPMLYAIAGVSALLLWVGRA